MLENILIVDDNPNNLHLLNEILTKPGYEVRVATSGRRALEVARLEPPDLILLDILMPDMDGYETCRQLKADECTGDIPIIFISAATEMPDQIKAFAMGGVDFISKPFQAEEVLVRVKTHLALRSTQQQLAQQNTQLEQEITERIRIAQELRQHRHHLEELVAARTAELQQEIAERKRVEAELQDSLQNIKIAYEQSTIYAQELTEEIVRRKKAQVEQQRLLELEQKQSEQLRTLAARLAEAEEIQRRQLARELHDQAGQNLTALSLSLKMVRDQMTAAKAPTQAMTAQVCGRLDDSRALVKETTQRIRNVMDYLRPPALEEYGLAPALQWYGQTFTTRTNIAVAVSEAAPRLPASLETALFRIAQEALTNVARHAQASRVDIELEVDEEMVRLTIVDNGLGFEIGPAARSAAPSDHESNERQHWGLLNMAERAQAVGGQCRVESAPGEGTRVVVEVKQ